MKDVVDDKQPKITEPGIYDLSMEVYHSDCCEGPSISSTGLRTIHNECPLEYWAFSVLNPKRYIMDDKGAYSFGRAAHCLIVGGEVFSERYVLRPRVIDEKPWQSNRTVCREWVANQLEAGLTIITPDDLYHIENMAKVLETHPMAETLLQGEVEKSLVWQDDETGVWLKARPDVIPTFDNVSNDYKTTTSICRPYELNRDIARYGYFMQLALVEEGLRVLKGAENLNMVLTFQTKKEPYHIAPIEISPEYLSLGHDLNRRALRTFADCWAKQDWPGYVEGIPVAHAPEWLTKQAEMETA